MKETHTSRWLLIDDERTLVGIDKIARTYNEGLNAILNEGPWDCIIFDHDLGDTSVPEKTGYDLMCRLEENPELIPSNIIVISQNPVGVQKMEKLRLKLLRIKDEAN